MFLGCWLLLFLFVALTSVLEARTVFFFYKYMLCYQQSILLEIEINHHFKRQVNLYLPQREISYFSSIALDTEMWVETDDCRGKSSESLILRFDCSQTRIAFRMCTKVSRIRTSGKSIKLVCCFQCAVKRKLASIDQTERNYFYLDHV